LDGVSYSIAERTLFDNLRFTLSAEMRVGLVGPNGSGKTTLLRLLRGDLEPTKGEIRKADGLRIVYFDQNRELDGTLTLRRALAPDSDSVIYQDRVIHVGAWAARFLFTAEELNRPVASFSGGERARILMAQLMLQPADLLLLDEPTNDLDIPTLEILEESLLEFRGALVLVTHDRYMLDRVSTVVLGLDGFGSAERFADYSQWDAWQVEQKAQRGKATKKTTLRVGDAGAAEPAAGAKKKLTFGETREFETIEQRVAEAEQELRNQIAKMEDPAVVSDAALIRETSVRMQEAQKAVEQLYARWAELEEKRG
jgi:ABC transport system ATP-binding/permease protein